MDLVDIGPSLFTAHHVVDLFPLEMGAHGDLYVRVSRQRTIRAQLYAKRRKRLETRVDEKLGSFQRTEGMVKKATDLLGDHPLVRTCRADPASY